MTSSHGRQVPDPSRRRVASLGKRLSTFGTTRTFLLNVGPFIDLSRIFKLNSGEMRARDLPSWGALPYRRCSLNRRPRGMSAAYSSLNF
jgi:hypothetical protein